MSSNLVRLTLVNNGLRQVVVVLMKYLCRALRTGALAPVPSCGMCQCAVCKVSNPGCLKSAQQN